MVAWRRFGFRGHSQGGPHREGLQGAVMGTFRVVKGQVCCCDRCAPAWVCGPGQHATGASRCMQVLCVSLANEDEATLDAPTALAADFGDMKLTDKWPVGTAELCSPGAYRGPGSIAHEADKLVRAQYDLVRWQPVLRGTRRARGRQALHSPQAGPLCTGPIDVYFPRILDRSRREPRCVPRLGVA